MGRLADAIRGIAMPDQKKRQMLALDQEFSDMEAEIQSLKSENLRLRAQVKPLEREVETLKHRVAEMEKEPAAHDLDENATQLLKAIANSDGRMPKFKTSQFLGLSKAQANYYFSLLIERGFIIQTAAMADPAYGIMSAGSKYLAERNLL